jgi:hypothetical protein
MCKIFGSEVPKEVEDLKSYANLHEIQEKNEAKDEEPEEMESDYDTDDEPEIEFDEENEESSPLKPDQLKLLGKINEVKVGDRSKTKFLKFITDFKISNE